MALVIPLRPIPSQTLQAQLGAQPCTINVYQQAFDAYIDLYVGGSLVVAGVVAQNRNRIVRDAYLGFSGDLAFIDLNGAADPVYTGFGSRYQLFYLTPADLAALGFAG